jgi:phospho-N-acetylmuramoyl-pentapeptide-transferase
MYTLLKKLLFALDPTTKIVPFTSLRAVLAFIAAFVTVWLIGPKIIGALYRRGFRDLPREYLDGFASSKAGTPTMGGVIIVLGIFCASLACCDLGSKPVPLLMLATFFFAGIGAMDDVQKVRRRHSDAGMSRKLKLAAQALFGSFFALLVVADGSSPFGDVGRTELFVPIAGPVFGWRPDLGPFGYGAFVVCVFLAVSNAVNFADGLDGLAIVPAAFSVAVYGAVAYLVGSKTFAADLGLETRPVLGEAAIYAAGVLGACTGFLWFNGYPASVFMGDTGSMALGGTLAALAVLTKQELLFLVVGGIFVYEFLSVLIQDTIGVSRLGRRLFFRAPAHHSFQHQGVAETKVVLRFWIVSLIFALVSFGVLTAGPRFGGEVRPLRSGESPAATEEPGGHGSSRVPVKSAEDSPPAPR